MALLRSPGVDPGRGGGLSGCSVAGFFLLRPEPPGSSGKPVVLYLMVRRGVKGYTSGPGPAEIFKKFFVPGNFAGCIIRFFSMAAKFPLLST